MSRPYKSSGSKAKFHSSIVDHSNVNVRLAADFLADAIKAAKSGNIQKFLTDISLAETFAGRVNFINPERNKV